MMNGIISFGAERGFPRTEPPSNLITKDPPAGIDSTLWRFSSPTEREQMVTQAKGPQYAVTDEIVVTGHRPAPGGGTLMFYEQASVWHQVEVTPEGTVTDTAGVTPPGDVTDDPNDKSDSVKVSVTNPSNRDAAMRAAANVQKGLNAYREMLSGHSRDQPLSINGKATTVGAELDKLKNTEFSVTDKSYTNGGVGQAVRGTGGEPNRVEFAFSSFDGEGDADYAHPNYQNNEGLLGIIGHELGHVSAEGATFNQQSRTYAAKENGEKKTNINFNDSVYWTNNEAWADSYSRDVAQQLGVNISAWTPTQGFDYQSPSVLYKDRKE